MVLNCHRNKKRLNNCKTPWAPWRIDVGSDRIVRHPGFLRIRDVCSSLSRATQDRDPHKSLAGYANDKIAHTQECRETVFIFDPCTRACSLQNYDFGSALRCIQD